MNTIEIKNLSKKFGDKFLFEGLNFNAKKGDVVSIIGPSGVGKSTLLKCIANLEKPTSGEIIVKGKIGMVFQQYNLFKNLTVIQNITLPLIKVQKKDKSLANQIALNVLEKVGLIELINSYPNRISGGQAQRVAIARAIALDPEIILLDEPTSALDYDLKLEVLELIREIATEKQRTILLVTHELDFAKTISDNVFEICKKVIRDR